MLPFRRLSKKYFRYALLALGILYILSPRISSTTFQDGDNEFDSGLMYSAEDDDILNRKVHSEVPPTAQHVHRPEEGNKATLGAHKFREDGLLEVNPDGRHPIYDLMARAERKWEEKLARQSKTLTEAVLEYKRRYQRDPPLGFDHW
jgi:hypothetical protein